MKRSAYYVLAAVLLAGIALSGCGSGDSAAPRATGNAAPGLDAALAKAAAGGRVFIVFDGTPDPAIVKGAGAKVVYNYHLVPAIAATGPGAVISKIAAHPRVIRVEPDGKVQALDAELDNAWGVKRIGAGTVHDGGNKGTGVKVAIIDSGIDYNHSDLDANYVVGGYDFVNDDADPMDDYGHGTHVAGTVAAEDNAEGVVGVAPEASLYALKVLGADGSGLYSDVIAALQRCVDNKIQVTNNSYGSSGDPGETVKDAFDNAAAAGVLHVGSAGNSGNPPGRGDNVGYPARFASVIAVAATDSSDKRARFSSTGPDVELAAPGVNINSTLLGGGYGEKSGTSMACPHVAGTAALVIAAGITDVRYQLQVTADDLGDPGWDTKYGWGLVDADEAAGAPVNNPPTVTITSPAGGSTFESGATIDFAGTANDTEDGDLTASLVWTSSIEVGEIGTGGSFSATLSDGVHTITASVTDSGGETGSDSVTITVGTLATLSVTVTTDSPSYAHRETVPITVTVTGDQGGIEGASVHLVITTPKGGASAKDGTTDGDGIATLTHKVNAGRDGVGTYTVEATASKDGYDPRSASTTFEVTK